MEPFKILKFWRSSICGSNELRTHTPYPIKTTLTEPHKKLEDDDDEGSFFDLKFLVPYKDRISHEETSTDREEDNGDIDSAEAASTDEERESNFTVSSSFSCTETDSNLSLSSSDDLFFKENLTHLQSLSSETNSKSSSPQFHPSFLKSAAKFRLFKFGFKKTQSNKLEEEEINASASISMKQKPQKHQRLKKIKVNGDSPIVLEQKTEQEAKFESRVEEMPVRENSFRNKIKPLYIRVSKRYSKFTEPEETSKPKNSSTSMKKEEIFSNSESLKQRNVPVGYLGVVCKHLGKSRSALTMASATAAVSAVPPFQGRRRDDSLLQEEEDGIKSAILHCKNSFSSSRDSSLLLRTTSDPCH